MWFSIKPPSDPPPPVLYDTTPLTVVDRQKYLGVIFDHRLTWSSHVAKVYKSMSYYLFLISPHVRFLPTTIVKMLMESLVFSRYTYALLVWGPAISRDCLSCLDRLQNRPVYLTCGLRKYDRVSRCRAGLRWLPVSQLCSIEVFLQCLGSIILVRVLHLVHLLHLGVNILMEPGVNHGLQTFFDLKKLLVNIFFDTRQLHGGMLYHLIYFMI